MKLLKLCIFVLFIAYVEKTQAQKNINYTLVSDNPYRINQLYFRVQPIYFEYFKGNTASFGGALELRYGWQNKYLLHVSNRKSYDVIAEGPSEENFIVRDFAVEYILLDKNVKKDISVTLSSSTSEDARYRYTYSKFINVPSAVRRSFGVRGGVFNYQSPFMVSELSKVNTSLIKGNLIRSTSVFGGLSYNIIHNTQIRVSGLRGIKSNAKWLNMYADVMYAPHLAVADIADSLQENMSSEKNRLGWRAGLLADFHTTKFLTFGGRAEIGSRPGFKNNGFFLYFGMGATIGLWKDKTDYTKE